MSDLSFPLLTDSVLVLFLRGYNTKSATGSLTEVLVLNQTGNEGIIRLSQTLNQSTGSSSALGWTTNAKVQTSVTAAVTLHDFHRKHLTLLEICRMASLVIRREKL
ncbi:hypothetical protein ATANTOWER_017859 [Ataeniobius toweri]|uniref:Uncharacterized protein n=1 Tax=Ataeniobius toweri TaxID=208326 RepID=A0ABU7BQB6_9TELE|nr:hypothetical protein [Ataeniobius toweri]